MSEVLQRIIEEREAVEAISSRYYNTINKHRWSNIENIRLSVPELLGKYISECDKEDEGVYRNHKFVLTAYQKYWLRWLKQKEYKYMITIKLPYRKIGEFKRTKNQQEAVEQLRKLIRDIEKAYTGHKHFEKDGFDFRLAVEHGVSGYWHSHLLVVADSMNYETTYNRLQKAIDSVLQKYRLFRTCIDLRYVYEQEGVCMYLVKELENLDNSHLKSEFSYLSSLYGFFHIQIRDKQPKYNKLYQIIKMIPTVLEQKKLNLLFRPNPIYKLKSKVV